MIQPKYFIGLVLGLVIGISLAVGVKVFKDREMAALRTEITALRASEAQVSCACLNEIKIQKACSAGVAGAIEQAVDSGRARQLLAILTDSGR